MAVSYPIIHYVEFPKDTHTKFRNYALNLLTKCKGKILKVFYSRQNSGFIACFPHKDFQDTFMDYFNFALNEDYIIPIWEEVNGYFISDETKNTLIDFYKILEKINPILDFIEINGGWPEYNNTPSAFEVLTLAAETNRLSDELKTAYNALNKLIINTAIFNLLSHEDPSLPFPKEIIFHKNLRTLYSDFAPILENFQPAVDFIVENGGWPQNDGSFPGFDELREQTSFEMIDLEIINSLKELSTFISMYNSMQKIAVALSTIKLTFLEE